MDTIVGRSAGQFKMGRLDAHSQFTSTDFVRDLKGRGVAVSMDGKGCWRDSVFVERLWKTIKYEHVYLRAYDAVSDVRAQLARFIEFYNTRRPHSALAGKTPSESYFALLPCGRVTRSVRLWMAAQDELDHL